MRSITSLLVGFISLACVTLPAQAGPLETCTGPSNAEETAPACTEIIENEKLSASDRARAYAARAETYKEFLQDDAVKDMDKAIELMPKIADYYQKRAEYKKKLPEAFSSYAVLKDLASAINLEPKKSERYTERAVYNLENDEYEAALPDLAKIIELKGNKGYLMRGLAYTRMGKTSEAISDLNKSIAALEADKRRLNQDNRTADDAFNFGLRGLNYLTLRQYDMAIADISIAISGHDHLVLHIMRGNAFAAKKQYEMAIEDYTKALKEKPDQIEAYYLRANAYEQIGQLSKATADRTEAALVTVGLKKPSIKKAH
ncbi:MAG: hypothetical protein JWL87_285 [Candidatus Adlerbacteria bacterium]|nr:hypothetical protein [Candidatus Adlerbacteria bacterium]